MSGLIAVPQCTAQVTLWTCTVRSGRRETSATSATTLLNDSCTATPRARPAGAGVLHPDFSATSLSAAAWRESAGRLASRNSIGSFPAAVASSSITDSITKAVWVFPTERHHWIGTFWVVVWSCTLRSATSYLVSWTPSVEELSGFPGGTKPSWVMIDCPTTTCRHPESFPSAVTPARMVWRYIGRYHPASVSSSRVQT